MSRHKKEFQGPNRVSLDAIRQRQDLLNLIQKFTMYLDKYNEVIMNDIYFEAITSMTFELKHFYDFVFDDLRINYFADSYKDVDISLKKYNKNIKYK